MVARNLLLPTRQCSRVASGNVLTDDIAMFLTGNNITRSKKEGALSMEHRVTA